MKILLFITMFSLFCKNAQCFVSPRLQRIPPVLTLSRHKHKIFHKSLRRSKLKPMVSMSNNAEPIVESFEDTLAQLKIDHKPPTLVLNADYTPLSYMPLSLWPWQDSIRAVMGGKAVVVSEYRDVTIRSVRHVWRLPSVIALKKYQRGIEQAPVLNKRNLCLRDNFQCQYCLRTLPPPELTMDHVIPKARGGRVAWDNIVCACFVCNYKKGSLGIEDIHKVNMRLHNRPFVPTSSELQQRGRMLKRRGGSWCHPDWQGFL